MFVLCSRTALLFSAQDHHNYPEPTFPMEPMDDRFRDYVKVIGEFGGHGLVLPAEHLWQTAKKHWGYDVLQDMTSLVQSPLFGATLARNGPILEVNGWPPFRK